MKKLLAVLLAVAMLLSFAACGAKNEAPANTDAAQNSAAPVDTSDFKVGVILIGDENEGYSYAHIEGVEIAKEALGLTDDQVIYKYNIPEDETCYDTAVDLAENGCNIIFANSFSHESYLAQAAAEYPDVMFCHATGQNAARYREEGLTNFANYFTSIYESRYVGGVVAGMKLAEMLESGEVTDPKVGYVGAYPYAEVVSGYTAFLLGIQSVVPEAYMEVTYTNSWFDIAAEAEAANSLMSDGCVIIGQHADSTGAPSAVQAALENGTTAYCVGYNVDMLSVAPQAALTSAQNCWDVYYTFAIDAAMKGEEIPADWSAGYNEDAVKISALGESCAEGTAEKVEEVIGKLKDGSLHVFDCSTFTVDGKTLDSYDQSYGFEGTELIWDGYFHESEVVSAPLFDIRIDGITELN